MTYKVIELFYYPPLLYIGIGILEEWKSDEQTNKNDSRKVSGSIGKAIS